MAKKTEWDWKSLWEALKEPLRLVVLGIVSWAIVQLAPKESQTALMSGLILALRFIDKALHEYGKSVKDDFAVKGLTRF